MKTLKLVIPVIFAVFFGVNSAAGTDENTIMGTEKTETMKVWGNCNMCKNRIEKAVRADGAISADWNVKTKILTVTFDPSRTSLDSFSKKLSEVGHDTEKYRADDKAYNALDSCCKYERKN